MAKFRDLYRVLGVPPRSHFRDIEDSYWEQAHALRLQPTRRAAQRLKVINEAYEVLASPHRRAEYDARWRQNARATDGERRPGMMQTFVMLLGKAFRPD
ncbi:MAG: DnaJ domain-containing protein [Chloroflexota bacterium]|nr:DnaJ domain-containing protein [Chloroflexota bacterium]